MARNSESRAFYASSCVCCDRGYVVKAGAFQACDCEAGAAWAAAHLAPVAQLEEATPAATVTEGPDLAPVVAGPARKVEAPVAIVPVAVREKTRRSVRFDGLSYELAQGVIRFRFGVAFEAYALTEKGPRLVDCSDRYSIPHLMAHHCRRFAEDLARKLRRVAA